jgi:tetratricopeptide (TPR) repeat protein
VIYGNSYSGHSEQRNTMIRIRNPASLKQIAYIRLGRLNHAKETLNKISDAYPENVQAHRMLGHVYLALQQLDEAADEFRAALRLRFDDPSLWTNLGHTLSRKNKYNEAHAAFERAAFLQPTDPEYAYNVGDNYLAMGQPKKAIASLTKAVQLSPNYDMAHYDLGLAFFELGKYEECMEASIACLRDDPEMKTQRSNRGIGATTNLGLAYMNLGKYKEAEECFRRNLKLTASTYFNLGLALFRQGHFKESLVNFQRALELKPQDAEYLDLLGNAYSELDLLTEAEGALRDAIETDNNYALAHYDMGIVLTKIKGREREALKSFKQAIVLDADLYWAYYAIACLYSLMGKKKLALQFLGKAFKKGFSDIAHLEKDTDLDNLRGDPLFCELKDKYLASV